MPAPFPIVSADDHMDMNVLPPDLWTSRLPARLRDRVPRVVDAADGPVWQADGRSWGPSGRKASGLIVRKQHGFRPGVPADRLADMDEDGVFAQIIYGPPTGFQLADAELKLEVLRAYNDWAAEYNAVAPDRLVVLAQLPGHDPGAAAAEVTRVAKLGHKGVQLGLHEGQSPVFEDEWLPFWAAAEDAGLPVSFHLAGGLHSIRPRPRSWRQPAMVAVVPMQLDEALAGMVFSGILERHPRLRIVMGESGLGWVPYVIERLDHEHHKYHDLMDDVRLAELPSVYVRRQVFFTWEQETLGVRLIPDIGVDNVMWASDYPHGDSTWPHSRRVIDETLGHLGEASLRKVVSENAAKLYALRVG